MSPEKTILIFSDWFVPAYKAGGPVQSVYNLALLLSRHYNIRVVCRDRDLNSSVPFDGIEPGKWLYMDERIQVLYLNATETGIGYIKSLVEENKSNILYINGIYSFKFSFLPAFFASYFGIKSTFISVRGMLHKSALSVKPFKKQIFLAFARGFGLYKNCTLLGSDAAEAAEIKSALGNVRIKIAPNIPMQAVDAKPGSRQFKGSGGKISFLFLGRIAPEKNSVNALKGLCDSGVKCHAEFCGTLYNDAYSKLFTDMLNTVPAGVSAGLLPELPHSQISGLFARHDVLLLPSKGENFGHAIFEAMLHGIPVIIGNNTPWKGIETMKAGIEVNPDDTDAIAGAVRFFDAMSPDTYNDWSNSARRYALDYLDANNFEEIYRNLFS